MDVWKGVVSIWAFLQNSIILASNCTEEKPTAIHHHASFETVCRVFSVSFGNPSNWAFESFSRAPTLNRTRWKPISDRWFFDVPLVLFRPFVYSFELAMREEHWFARDWWWASNDFFLFPFQPVQCHWRTICSYWYHVVLDLFRRSCPVQFSEVPTAVMLFIKT